MDLVRAKGDFLDLPCFVGTLISRVALNLAGLLIKCGFDVEEGG